MDKKKKVLIVNEPLDLGGMDIEAINLQQNLNKDIFESEYCVRRDHKGPLEQMVLDSGADVYHVPNSELNYIRSYKFYKSFFSEHSYDIVHCHLPFFSGIVFIAAKKSGNPKCVAHGHFTQAYNNKAVISIKDRVLGSAYRQIMRVLLKKYCDVKLACSEEAGNYLYGKSTFQKEGIVLNNGIDLERFHFSKEKRELKRNELGISKSTVVLGHVGMMNGVKNQLYIIDCFAEFNKKRPDSKLILVGEGPDFEKVKERRASVSCSDKIILLGWRKDVPDLYMAMDCFVFPSLHEGFPLTLIEAQASKLPCVVSKNVTEKVKLNSNIEFLSIDESPTLWAEKIEELVKINRESIDNSKVINEFDIKSITRKLETLYLS